MNTSLRSILTLGLGSALLSPLQAADEDSLEVLFIGNSYTGRHNLSQVVEAMAEAGQEGLEMNVTTVIYGGRRLVDHWRLGTGNFVRLHEVTAEEVEATIESLEKLLVDEPEFKYAKSGLVRQNALLKELEQDHPKWDVVVLQSYRDDLEGADSLYMKYAPRYAELVQAQGGRVILYETSPNTQNAEPMETAPDAAPIMEKARSIATLANAVDAAVAPMSLIGLKAQTERPDLTLRFINDAHLNHTMAYMTACAIYAAMFDESPVGLPVDSITDIRFWQNTDREKDRDGKPITRTFSEEDREDLQRMAWEGYLEMKELQKTETP